jgi:hypothetical protein
MGHPIGFFDPITPRDAKEHQEAFANGFGAIAMSDRGPLHTLHHGPHDEIASMTACK